MYSPRNISKKPKKPRSGPGGERLSTIHTCVGLNFGGFFKPPLQHFSQDPKWKQIQQIVFFIILKQMIKSLVSPQFVKPPVKQGFECKREDDTMENVPLHLFEGGFCDNIFSQQFGQIPDIDRAKNLIKIISRSYRYNWFCHVLSAHDQRGRTSFQ